MMTPPPTRWAWRIQGMGLGPVPAQGERTATSTEGRLRPSRPMAPAWCTPEVSGIRATGRLQLWVVGGEE